MLVDGGVLANLPVSQAIEIGATRVYVLPAIAEGIGSVPSGAIDMMQRSMMIATAALAKRDLDDARGCAEVHVVPVPTAAQLSMFDFGETQVLMEGASLSTAAWLRESERELAL
jgi:NTE family protein